MEQALVSHIEKDKKEKDVYWVQSFNPKHSQLWYQVVLQAEVDNVRCACPAFRGHSDRVCKHILYVVENEGLLK